MLPVGLGAPKTKGPATNVVCRALLMWLPSVTASEPAVGRLVLFLVQLTATTSWRSQPEREIREQGESKGSLAFALP